MFYSVTMPLLMGNGLFSIQNPREWHLFFKPFLNPTLFLQKVGCETMWHKQARCNGELILELRFISYR